MKTLRVLVVVFFLMAIGAVAIYRFLPVHRVDVSSELIMLGDLNGDRVWNGQDEVRLEAILEHPFAVTADVLHTIDVNRNDAIDSGDLSILEQLYRLGDPYVALEQARGVETSYPRPRELFKYLPRTEYVSRTSPQMTDLQLRNHNLPMILLFREALRIKRGDKLAAVGLLDESVRIPLGWVKGIPPEALPSSLALDNFLLPGNMEDGTDKSRHWNVFGGIALYKSPEDSLILSLKREIMDVRDEDHSVEAVREFIRDTIANINGIYYVVSMNPDLI